MKRAVVSALVAAILVIGLYGILDNLLHRGAPVPVKTAFKIRFPGVYNVNWEKTDSGYAAHWGGLRGMDSTTWFSLAGKPLRDSFK